MAPLFMIDKGTVQTYEGFVREAIPTLGEWSLIILGLFISIFGVVGIRQSMLQPG